jgi:hypothetical protein
LEAKRWKGEAPLGDFTILEVGVLAVDLGIFPGIGIKILSLEDTLRAERVSRKGLTEFLCQSSR